MTTLATCEEAWLRLIAKHTDLITTQHHDNIDWSLLGSSIDLNRFIENAEKDTLATAIVSLMRSYFVYLDAPQLTQSCKNLLALFQASHAVHPFDPHKNVEKSSKRHLLAIWVWQVLSATIAINSWPDLVAAAHEVTRWLVGICVFDARLIDSHMWEGPRNNIWCLLDLNLRYNMHKDYMLHCRGAWQTFAILGSSDYNISNLVLNVCNKLTDQENWVSTVEDHAWWWLDVCAHFVSQDCINMILGSLCLAPKQRSCSFVTCVRLVSLFLPYCRNSSMQETIRHHPVMCLLSAAAEDDTLAGIFSLTTTSRSKTSLLLWFDIDIVLSFLSDQANPNASTCAELVCRRWHKIDRPLVHGALVKYLISDVANLVIDALVSPSAMLVYKTM
jgi:hypothetical protein